MYVARIYVYLSDDKMSTFFCDISHTRGTTVVAPVNDIQYIIRFSGEKSRFIFSNDWRVRCNNQITPFLSIFMINTMKNIIESRISKRSHFRLLKFFRRSKKLNICRTIYNKITVISGSTNYIMLHNNIINSWYPSIKVSKKNYIIIF